MTNEIRVQRSRNERDSSPPLGLKNEMSHTESKGVSTKKCNKCQLERLLVLYCRNRNGRDGLNWICNKCKNETRKKVQCSCGKMVYKDYLDKHVLTSLHWRNLEVFSYSGLSVQCC